MNVFWWIGDLFSSCMVGCDGDWFEWWEAAFVPAPHSRTGQLARFFLAGENPGTIWGPPLHSISLLSLVEWWIKIPGLPRCLQEAKPGALLLARPSYVPYASIYCVFFVWRNPYERFIVRSYSHSINEQTACLLFSFFLSLLPFLFLSLPSEPAIRVIYPVLLFSDKWNDDRMDG